MVIGVYVYICLGPNPIPSLDRRIRNVLMCTFVHFGTSDPLDLRDLRTLGGSGPPGDGVAHGAEYHVCHAGRSHPCTGRSHNHATHR